VRRRRRGRLTAKPPSELQKRAGVGKGEEKKDFYGKLLVLFKQLLVLGADDAELIDRCVSSRRVVKLVHLKRQEAGEVTESLCSSRTSSFAEPKSAGDTGRTRQHDCHHPGLNLHRLARRAQ